LATSVELVVVVVVDGLGAGVNVVDFCCSRRRASLWIVL
jgi:hypothetical protein